MRRDWLHRMRAIPLTLHQKLRFPTMDGIMEFRGDQVAAKQSVLATIKQKGVGQPRVLWRPQTSSSEEAEVILDGEPEKVSFEPPELYFLIGSSLPTCNRCQLIELLVKNKDVFAWSAYESLEMSSDLAVHSLNIVPNCKPVIQRRRKLASKKASNSIGKGRTSLSG